MIYEAVQKQDFPLLQGAFIVLAFSVILMTLLTDLVVAWLDPRVKLRRDRLMRRRASSRHSHDIVSASPGSSGSW